jgi:hypothetical protein
MGSDPKTGKPQARNVVALHPDRLFPGFVPSSIRCRAPCSIFARTVISPIARLNYREQSGDEQHESSICDSHCKFADCLVLASIGRAISSVAHTHNNAAEFVAVHTALLMDTGSGLAFNCSAQFDTRGSKFTSESACLAMSLDGKPPSGQIAWVTMPQNFGWIPLWSVDQQSGEVTFCTARTTIQGVAQLWCTQVPTRK